MIKKKNHNFMIKNVAIKKITREEATLLLKRVISREHITRAETSSFFKAILDNQFGVANDVMFGAFFAVMQCNKPTKAEVLGLIDVVLFYDRVLIANKFSINDICGIIGSGKDDLKTFNVSTCAAFIAAGAGVKVVKNGSRSESSISGTTDVMELLGVDINMSPDKVMEALKVIGITFCDAEPYFPKMGKMYVGKFFFPHPLSYILSVASGIGFDRILFGSALPETEFIGELLVDLGFKRFMVVAGSDMLGKTLDEISNIGPTKITEFNGSSLKTYVLQPQDMGMATSDYKEIKQGKSKEDNAFKVRSVLENKASQAMNDIVLMNAGALIYISGQATSLLDGIDKARLSLKNGFGLKKMRDLANFS